MNKTAGAIIRVSSAEQLKGTSMEKQLETIQSLADEQGYDLPDENVWQTAESGGKKASERIGFQKALSASKAGKITRLYVYSVDRLARDLVAMITFVKDLESLGVDTWLAETGKSYSESQLLHEIQGAMAAEFLRDHSKKVTDGKRRSALAGNFAGGNIHYGFRAEGNGKAKQVVIDEDEAEVVQDIYRWLLEEGLSTVKIAKRLNSLDVQTKHGKRWHPTSVHKVLTDPVYIGKRTYMGEVVEGHAIVDEAIFNRVPALLKANKFKRPKNAKQEYLLAGLIRCDVCGRTYRSRTKHQNGKVYRFYRCNGRYRPLDQENRCPVNKGLKAEAVEEVVWSYLAGWAASPDMIDDELGDSEEPLGDTAERMAEVKDQIKELKRQERNALQIATRSKVVDIETLDQTLAEIRANLAEAEQYLSTLENAEGRRKARAERLFGAKVRLGKLQDRLLGPLSFEDKRAIINSWISEVRVSWPSEQPFLSINYTFEDIAYGDHLQEVWIPD